MATGTRLVCLAVVHCQCVAYSLSLSGVSAAARLGHCFTEPSQEPVGAACAHTRCQVVLELRVPGAMSAQCSGACRLGVASDPGPGVGMVGTVPTRGCYRPSVANTRLEPRLAAAKALRLGQGLYGESVCGSEGRLSVVQPLLGVLGLVVHVVCCDVFDISPTDWGANHRLPSPHCQWWHAAGPLTCTTRTSQARTHHMQHRC